MSTDSQKIDILYKKLYGKSDTNDNRQYFEEPYGKDYIIRDSQLQLGFIPNTSPAGTPVSGTAGVYGNVELIKNLTLSAVVGSPNAFYHINLVNNIPTYFDPNGSYVHYLEKNAGGEIVYGEGVWRVDSEAGTVVFYGDLPSGVSVALPPKISFYRYVGITGLLGGNANAIQLDGIDINATGPSVYDALIYDGTNWSQSSLVGGSGKKVLFDLNSRNFTITSGTTPLVIGAYTWLAAENNRFGQAKINMRALINGTRQIEYRMYDVTNAIQLSSTQITSGTGFYSLNFSSPTTNSLIEFQGKFTAGVTPNPVVSSAHIGFNF